MTGEQMARAISEAFYGYDVISEFPPRAYADESRIGKVMKALDALAPIATLQATVERQAAEIAELRHKLDLAAGRLNWASVANPGARTDEGRRLLATWADEARQALGDTNEQ